MQTAKETARQIQAQPAATLPHNVIMENRCRMDITGVTRIVSCDENSAVLETQQGTLTVGGSELSVSELSIRTGELKISGKLEFLQYTQPAAHSPGGFLRRLAR